MLLGFYDTAVLMMTTLVVGILCLPNARARELPTSLEQASQIGSSSRGRHRYLRT